VNTKAAERQGDRWSSASLGIYGEPLDLDRITESLELDPTSSGRKGDVRTSPRTNSELPPRRNSFWLLTSPLSVHEPLQNHLAWIADRLEPKRAIFDELTREYEIRLVCGYSSESGQGGCTFDPKLLARLSSFKIPLVLDLYPPGPITADSDSL
jgi:hypothetical protein